MAKKQIATFLGPNPRLVIAGEHCYAYNTAPASETSSDILAFTTGKHYIVGTIQLNANTKADDPATGAKTTLAMNFNGTLIFVLKATTIDALSPSSASCDILIPPLTSVTATIDSSSNTATYIGSAVLVGRIYA